MPGTPRPTTGTRPPTADTSTGAATRTTALPTALARVAPALRERLGWICCAAGVLLCALGWYGVSGERYAARQIPYLASATAPGTALIVGGSILLAARRRNAQPTPELEQMQRQLAVLTHLLTEAAQAERAESAERGPDGAASGAANGAPWLLSVPGGRTYHRSECLLVLGRQDPERLLNGDATARGLRPCPLCEPPEEA